MGKTSIKTSEFILNTKNEKEKKLDKQSNHIKIAKFTRIDLNKNRKIHPFDYKTESYFFKV